MNNEVYVLKNIIEGYICIVVKLVVILFLRMVVSGYRFVLRCMIYIVGWLWIKFILFEYLRIFVKLIVYIKR